MDEKKREKVIFAIENCLTTDSVTECRKTECPFISCRESCLEWLLRSVLALLREQEPRVMAEGDVLHSTGKPMWFESRGMYLGQKGFWCLLFEVDAELHIRFVQSVTGGKITLALFDYGKLWRFWTSRPTPEQMRGTPWEEKAE